MVFLLVKKAAAWDHVVQDSVGPNHTKWISLLPFPKPDPKSPGFSEEQVEKEA